MSTRARLDRLVRVRRAERDGARLEHAVTEREARRAEQASGACRQQLSAESDALAAEAMRGEPASWWRSALAGLRVLAACAEEARAASREARERSEASLRTLVEARRRLRAAERLAERFERRLRRDRARAAQRRLDEVGQRRRSPGLRSGVLVLLLLSLAAPGRLSAEPETASPDHGVALLLGELRARQAELDARERELADRERRVGELESGVRARLDELETLATTVEDRIAGWEYANEDKSISRLAKIYGTMAPRTAASLLEQLDLDLATRIVAKMKHKQSAALLPLLSQPRALAMSRNVAHPLGKGLQARGDAP